MSQKMRDDVADEVEAESGLSLSPPLEGETRCLSGKSYSPLSPSGLPQGSPLSDLPSPVVPLPIVSFPGLLRDRIRTAVSFAVQLLPARQRQALLRSFEFSPEVAAFLNESDRYHTNGLSSSQDPKHEGLGGCQNAMTNEGRCSIDLTSDAVSHDQESECDQYEIDALRALRGHNQKISS